MVQRYPFEVLIGESDQSSLKSIHFPDENNRVSLRNIGHTERYLNDLTMPYFENENSERSVSKSHTQK